MTEPNDNLDRQDRIALYMAAAYVTFMERTIEFLADQLSEIYAEKFAVWMTQADPSFDLERYKAVFTKRADEKIEEGEMALIISLVKEQEKEEE